MFLKHVTAAVIAATLKESRHREYTGADELKKCEQIVGTSASSRVRGRPRA